MSLDASSHGPRLYADNPSALPVGTRLGEFELLSLLGVGGFGIVYLAFDHALEREVAVKEYMPASLAGRTQTMHVSLRSQSDAETFALGLKSFVNEARLLARFDHPSLLKVYRFWEANGTAYMAMPVLRGRTVKEERLDMPAPPDEAWLRALLKPLLGALDKLHAEGVYHRDIAPDNIQIEPGGRPVLLDFGAARRVISDKSQTLTAILKPAYAPIEQYAETGSVKQGPWTDIYALGATLHFLLLKRPPPPATTRTVYDEASALTPQALPHCSALFLQTIDWMLAPRPNDRPQSIAALRQVLDGHAPLPQWRPAEPAPPPELSEDTVMFSKPLVTGNVTGKVTGNNTANNNTANNNITSSHHAAAQAAVTAAMRHAGANVTSAPSNTKVVAAQALLSTTPVARAPGSSTTMLVGGAVVGVLALVAMAAFFWPKSAAVPALPVQQPAVAAPAAGNAVINKPADNVVPPVPTSTAASSAMAEPLAPPMVTPAHEPDTAPAAATSVVTTPAVKEPAVVVKKPAIAASRPQAGSAQATAKPAPAPVARSEAPPSASVIAPAVTPAVIPAITPPVAEASKPPITGPEARCAGLPYFKNLVCMERECLRSDTQSHPDCLKWRRGTSTDNTYK